MRIPMSFIIAVTFALLARPCLAESVPFTGMVFEHIDESGVLSSVFLPSVGTQPSPKSSGNEIAEAIAQFRDQNELAKVLENYKRKAGYSGGKVFVSFRYRSDGSRGGELDVLCGVSPNTGTDPDEIILQSKTFSTDPRGVGKPFKNFKKAPRADRIRSIARCFAYMGGMPKDALLPAPRPELKYMSIDERSYQEAELMLHKFDPAGYVATRKQYRGAFECLVASAARADSEITGD
jgi:hypothetical protein